MRRGWGIAVVFVLVAFAVACRAGGAGAWDEVASPTSGGEPGGYAEESAMMERSPAPVDAEYDAAPATAPRGSMASPVAAPPPPQIAQAGSSTPLATRTDAVEAGTPILIYTANLAIAVHHVDERQEQLIALAREHQGFMSVRTADQLVLRIPASHFDAVMEAIDQAGGILSREIRAEDVGRQYRDIRIRIGALDTMRERLEQLLARAENIEHALQVERELERVVTQLEQLKGLLRHLDDRIAFSTITIVFRPVETVQVDERFELPFRWLRELGIDRLLRL